MDWIEARQVGFGPPMGAWIRSSRSFDPQEALKLQDEDEREDSEATTPAMGMGMGPGPAAGMHAESSAQAASRQAAADLSRTGSLPGRQRARQRVSGSPRMEDDEAPADAEPSTLPIPVVRTDHQRMARAPSHSRQRDTLVQAMNRHQSERRGRGRSEVAEDALIVSNSTRGLAPQEGASPPVYRDQPRGSMFEASSPLQAYAPNTPFQPRPAKALPHHAKSKQGNTITANPGSSSIFAPDLPVDIPFIPLFNPDATGSVDASLVSGGATPDADVRVGAKRPLMVEPSVFGAGRGDGTAAAPPIGVNKALRRRMGVRGDAGERWTGGETASTPVSDSEERDRKRVTRRG